MESRVLVSVVDDDLSVREWLPDLLTGWGFEAHAFPSAADFLASSDLHQARCLILDMAMPGMTGIGLQQELKRRRPDLPIVFITATRDESIRRKILKRGAIECLFKPFSEAALLQAVNAALENG